jgi:acetyl-CoA carboxylase biotin carboxyl carrier protein
VSLTAAEVAEIMRLVEQSGFDELTLEIEGTKICLRRGSSGSVLGAEPFAAGSSDAPNSAAPAPTALAATLLATADRDTHLVVAPLLGTFYRAPKPGAPPFVELGTVVEEDTIVGIIEVMKLMNTVRAGARGIVIEILIADGALAEYGETLLRVRKAG